MLRRILISMGLRSRTASEWGEMVRIQAQRNHDLQQRIMALQESNASMAQCIRGLGRECLKSNAQVEMFLEMVQGADYGR